MTAAVSYRVKLVTAVDGAYWLASTYGVEVRPATIRQWASRDHLARYGQGRARYDLDEVVAQARLRGLLDG